MNRIEDACREMKLRVTGQRRLIAEVIADARDHPDVAELHRRVSARDRSVSLATVYRTVKLFEAKGIIERHALLDRRSHYKAHRPGTTIISSIWIPAAWWSSAALR